MLNDEYEAKMTDQYGLMLVNIEQTSYPTYNLDHIDNKTFEEILCESI
jgi:hypothetical protein